MAEKGNGNRQGKRVPWEVKRRLMNVIMRLTKIFKQWWEEREFRKYVVGEYLKEYNETGKCIIPLPYSKNGEQ